MDSNFLVPVQEKHAIINAVHKFNAAGQKNMNVMPISDIIEKVTQICRKQGVERLDLFGSFATHTATPTSDIDFVVYGCKNLLTLQDEISQIETLRKIDIFDFDSIKNEYLLEDISKYGKQIY